MVAILRSDHLPYTVQRDELNKLAFKILSANQPAQQQSPRAISPVRHPAPGYEGDYGDTFVFGDDVVHQRCARAARAVFDETRDAWLGGAEGIALYAFAETAALRHGCTLVHEMTLHRIADFPYALYGHHKLAQAGFVPGDGLWVVEIQLRDHERPVGAFFEDISLRG